MKLEVGKYYKTRLGHKWKCVHKMARCSGRVFICTDESNCETYYEDGMWMRASKNPNGYDLISEWVEPVEHEVEVWFYKSKDGVVSQNSGCFSPYKINPPIAKIKVKFTEGDGL